MTMGDGFNDMFDNVYDHMVMLYMGVCGRRCMGGYDGQGVWCMWVMLRCMLCRGRQLQCMGVGGVMSRVRCRAATALLMQCTACARQMQQAAGACLRNACVSGALQRLLRLLRSATTAVSYGGCNGYGTAGVMGGGAVTGVGLLVQQRHDLSAWELQRQRYSYGCCIRLCHIICQFMNMLGS